ncbi:hypothetical protein AVEN_6687-1 [Araneus ventricosus]|uniref:Uncharacterized protein n=2 Tax=Araneus ventricosus TaxID=182803 RepID=A0A4Y2IPQ4_ARAVE|nr:hypothetical protein AVEN_237126-1 [Araneus ventricosus]GBM78912.1 hypothetical protein AVEN_6687-1 [Araneus ventricosus]
MSPRTGSIRKYQNSQSLMGVLPSLDSKQNLTLTSVGEVQLSTPPDKRNPPVYVLIRVLISQVTFLSTTCKKSHIYVSLVSTFPTKVNVIHRPSNPRFVTLN